MNNIICAIDFSEASINALEHAAAVAEKCGSRLTLLHVFTEKDFNRLFEEDEDHVNRSFKENSIVIEERLKTLQREIKDADHRHINEVDYILEFGDFIQTVEELEENYDLIVMGSHGMSHHQGFVLGSNTLEIISQTEKAVLAIPEGASYQAYTHIIYASDLHQRDKVGLNKLITMASCFDARIQVVHFTSKSITKEQEEYNEFINELSSFISYPKIGYDLKKFDDELNIAMEDYTMEKKGHLLALLDKKRNFFESLFSESLIEKMTYITDTPLLVLKS